MRIIDDTFIIGIDSGYGNIKTANCCFPASVAAYDTEPVFKDNMLVYGNRFYLIGEGHKEFLADKTRDNDYYVLALAAIAREMNIKKLTSGKIRIAAGLPLTWVSGQRDDFKNYLLQNRSVEFSFRNTNYSIEVVGVDVFPQGFALRVGPERQQVHPVAALVVVARQLRGRDEPHAILCGMVVAVLDAEEGIVVRNSHGVQPHPCCHKGQAVDGHRAIGTGRMIVKIAGHRN